jgi:hypothetical protein
MEIGLFYSKSNAEHQKMASLVKRAIKNLGILAHITEMESPISSLKLFVDGFDLTSLLKKSDKDSAPVTYDLVERALEKVIW